MAQPPPNHSGRDVTVASGRHRARPAIDGCRAVAGAMLAAAVQLASEISRITRCNDLPPCAGPAVTGVGDGVARIGDVLAGFVRGAALGNPEQFGERTPQDAILDRRVDPVE
jgi:hypothetical protein